MAPEPDAAEPVMLEVGRIDRPHGLTGEVVVTLLSTRPERLAPGSVLSSDRGPLTVRSSRPHQHRFLVRFDRIPDCDSAEEWRGVDLSAEAVDEPDDGTLWAHRLIGATVIDQHGTRHGTVRSVIDNPASDLLELEDGRLIPAVFVVGNVAGSEVRVEVPDGLLDDGGV
ncbi:MAG: 16S rRNA processing protein RimM [Acidimicrobiia bacterium]|nr:16S rRNA processing protein RimM [Actinomycetota bacterium]MBL6923875.1 16S rRNA processing protein RimM [Acidimicrobiia bacterium]MBL6926366.1 16S rRNA processing protein RimM [Acidimicrobiia bacterium]